MQLRVMQTATEIPMSLGCGNQSSACASGRETARPGCNSDSGCTYPVQGMPCASEHPKIKDKRTKKKGLPPCLVFCCCCCCRIKGCCHNNTLPDHWAFTEDHSACMSSSNLCINKSTSASEQETNPSKQHLSRCVVICCCRPNLQPYQSTVTSLDSYSRITQDEQQQ